MFSSEDSQPTTGVIYVPDYSSRQHDDDDDDEDDVIDIEDDDLEEDDDDDDVEVVSLRSLKNEIASIPGTPRSVIRWNINKSHILAHLSKCIYCITGFE